MTPENFKLFDSKDSSIQFNRNNNGIILLAEKMNNAFPLLGNIEIGSQIRTLFVPKTFNAASFSVNFSELDVKKLLGSSRYRINQNINTIQQSFIFDSTPYISKMYGNTNPKQFVSLANRFYSNIVNYMTEEAARDITNWSLVYVFDEALLRNKITPSNLYFWFFLKECMDNDGRKNIFPFNNVFVCWIKNGSTVFTKVYEKNVEIDFSKIKAFMLRNRTDIINRDDDIIKEVEQSQQNKPPVNKQSITVQNPSLTFDKILSMMNPLKLPNDKKEKEEKQIETKANEMEKKEMNKLPNDVKEKMKTEEAEQVKKDIHVDNLNNFPFLLSKGNPQFNVRKITDDEIENVSKFIALKDGVNKTRDWIVDKFNKVKSMLLTHDKQATEAVKMFKDKKYSALSVYVNQATEEFTSKIYETKPTVQREVLDNMDKWADERGYMKPQSIDPVLNAQVLNKHIKSNFHRAMSQKEMTWKDMPQQIEEMITPVLEDAGFKFLSVLMVDNEPDPSQVEPTYMTDIRIKLQNMRTKKTQTVKFKVPTLLEGKYHISGGIKWLFPNVVATLPIFVVNPGKVQFKTNYSAMTFQHNVTSKKDVVTVLVGGVKMPLLIWLLQLKSFDDICQKFSIQYRIVENKKELDPSALVIKLPERKFMEFKISASDFVQQKIAKAIFYDLQPLVNKMGMFELHKPDDEADILVKLTGRKTASYSFRKIKRYLIDMRTASLLRQRQINPELFDVTCLCAKYSITNVDEDKLGANNIYLRLMDLIPAEIERAFHYSLTEFRRRSAIDPDANLMVNEGWVINALREQAVLILYRDGNPAVESAQFSAVRLVGPGGFAKTDSVQGEDRRIPISHFGIIDPVDTPEGNPGIQTQLTSGFEYDPDHKTFTEVAKNDNMKNMFSVCASQIPFIGNDDGNRAQFGCSQMRQAVPLLNSEAPLVGTGIEGYIASYGSNKFVKKAKRNGVVTYIDKNVMILKYDDGNFDRIDIKPDSLQTGSGKANGLIHTPIVKVGQRVNAFQQLVKNPFINGGYTAGINVLTAYKSEECFTYEDGVVVSESFAKKFASSHYDSIDVSLDGISELKIFPLQKYKETGEMFYKKGEPIIKIAVSSLGGFQENTVVAPSDCQVVDIQIYPAKEEFIPLVREVDKALNGATNQNLAQCGLKRASNVNSIIDNIGKFKFRKQQLTRTLIRIKVVSFLTVGLGDKFSLRHGNKGVCTLIKPDNMMPVLPDGRRVDVCLNPLGVSGRMNLGQLMELHVGNILDKARRNLQGMNDNQARDMLCKLYSLLDGTKNKELSEDIIQSLKAMGAVQLHQTIEHLKQNGIRMIFPAYCSPKIEEINEAAELVGTHLKDKLFLPQYNRKTINECAWGFVFMQKLEHISQIKENVRTVGRNIATTLMPSKAGNHRNAIRIGEFDTWCYEANDSKDVLRDFFLVNGNNPKAKLQVISDIENNGKADVELSDIELGESGSSRAFKVYTITAGLSIK